MLKLPATAIAALVALASFPAIAQVATPPETTAPDAPAPSAGGNSTVDPCAGQPNGTGGNQTLTGQLRNCDGVLTPPDTGASGIEAPAPDPNPDTTPVIPPGAVPDQPSNNGGAGGTTNGG